MWMICHSLSFFRTSNLPIQHFHLSRRIFLSLTAPNGIRSASQPQRLFPASNAHSLWRPLSSYAGKDCTNTKPTILKRLVAASPSNVQPYMKLVRLDSPAGFWLIFLPSAWGIALATPLGELPPANALILCGIGAFLMRGAGCVINDFWDKEYDRAVARTSSRPLACGKIGDKHALTYLGGILFTALIVLLQFNWYTVMLGVTSLVFVVSYPLCKRLTYWPQLCLGVTLNWGALMGFAAVQGSCHWPICWPLYISAVHWTLIYDTIYAHQDKSDDLLVGVKSTALLFGKKTKKWLSCFALGNLLSLSLCGFCADAGIPYYVGVLLFNAHLCRQIYQVDLDSQKSCFEAFSSNRNGGLLFLNGIILDRLLAFPYV